MGCRIIVGHEQGSDREIAALFCSTSGTVFGPLFHEGEDQAEAFLSFLKASGVDDPRRLSVPKLMDFYGQFVRQPAATEA